MPSLLRRRMYAVLPVLLCLLCLVIASGMSQGAEQRRIYGSQLEKRQAEFTEDLAYVRQAIRRALPPIRQKMLDTIQFESGASSAPFPTAEKYDDKRVISLPLSAYDVFMLISKATFLAESLKYPPATVQDYAAELAARAKPSRSQDAIRMLTYEEYMHIGQEEFKRVVNDRAYARIRELTRNSLGYVVAHELGHHALGHFESPRLLSSKHNEDEADLFAANIGGKAGWDPFTATAAFVFQQGLLTSGAPQEAYSSPSCRMARIQSAAGRALITDPRHQTPLRGTSELELFRNRMKAAEEYVKTKC